MLIINADDLGRDAASIDTCLYCFAQGSVSSASLMVFMADSERAARAARLAKLETGLHINLTEPFSCGEVAESVKKSQLIIARYLLLGKWAPLVYNPLLRGAVAKVFQAQLDEYRRLCQSEPAHFNGHRHMHLCMNMIVNSIIPQGQAVRRNFTFFPGEKGIINRLYRHRVDSSLKRRYLLTDAFFSIEPVGNPSRVRKIIDLARICNVELMVHTYRKDQLTYLGSDEFRNLIATVRLGAFSNL